MDTMDLVEETEAADIVARLGLTRVTERIADELTSYIKREFLAAAANPSLEQSGDSFTAGVQTYLSNMTPETRESFHRKSTEVIRADAELLQAFIGPDPMTYRPGETRFELSRDLTTSLQTQLSLLRYPWVLDEMKTEPSYNKLGFYITNVQCIDETDEASASDEILLSGIGVYPTGEIIKPNVWKMYDFDAGEVVQPRVPRLFAEFDLRKGNYWPKSYVVSVVLAEEDSGGFGDFLKNLWSNIESKAVAAIGAAVGATIGTAVGSAVGGIIGAVAGAVFGAIIGWLVNLFNNPDDLIGTQKWTLTLATNTQKYFQNLPMHGPVSPSKTITFIGDGGHYKVNMFWKVYN